MSVTIINNKLKVKDGNGNYIGIDAISDATTQEKITAINAAGTAQINAITTQGETTRATIPSDYTVLSDDVDELKSALFVLEPVSLSVSDFSIGTITSSNGQNDSSTTRARLNNAIYLPVGSLITVTDNNFAVFEYSGSSASSDEYQGFRRALTDGAGTYIVTANNWYRILLAFSDNATVTSENIETLTGTLSMSKNTPVYLTNATGVTTASQNLTEDQKTQVRINIGASDENDTNELQSEVFVKTARPIEWVQGAWSNAGELNTTTSYIKTRSFQCGKIIIRINEGYLVVIGKWDNQSANSRSHFVENLIGAYNNMADVREFVFTGETGYWYRVSIKKVDGTNIDTSVSSNVTLIDKTSKIDEKADVDDINANLLAKLNVPSAGYGISGQILKSNGTSFPVWVDDESISGNDIRGYVEDWLETNPQAYVQIEDGSIEEDKFAQNALRYVTPEMFGAVADGETSDSEAIQSAINYAIAHGCVLDGKGKTYALDGSGQLPPDWTSTRPIRGLSASSSITIQNMNLVLIDEAIEGTSVLHIKCDKGQRIIIDRVNIDGNLTNQSSTVSGDGNMSGIKVGLSSQYGSENGSGSIIIKNCYIKNCFTDGIGIGATNYENLVIKNCVIENSGRNGITDNSLNNIVTGCKFINNGIRTAPRTQYETEPEQIREFQTRVLDNCTFVSDYDNIIDITFLFKIEKVSQEQSDSIEHLIISNCQCKTIAIQSQTMTIPSVFKHITIKDTNCNQIRFVPANGAIAVNQDMNIINCKVSDISVTVGNVTIKGCDISGAISFNVENLIVSNCMMRRDVATSLQPVATNAIIDGNIMTNYTLDETGITNLVGDNIFI